MNDKTPTATPLDARAAELQAMPRPTLETYARTLERELAARDALLVAAHDIAAIADRQATAARAESAILRAALEEVRAIDSALHMTNRARVTAMSRIAAAALAGGAK